jgi:hypothetical protein
MVISLAHEVRIIAYLKLQTRLETLVAASLAYQKALTNLRKYEGAFEEVNEAAAEIEVLEEKLDPKVGLESFIEKRQIQTKRELTNAQTELEKATDSFLKTTQPITQMILGLIEEYDYKIDSNDLKEELTKAASVAAEGLAR